MAQSESWEERARKLLAEIERSESGDDGPRLLGDTGPELEQQTQLLDDLFAEGFVRSSGKPLKNGMGHYVAVVGLRLTNAGREFLRRPTRTEEVSGVTTVEHRRLEVVLRVVQQADHEGELDRLGDVGRDIKAQADTLRAQLYAPEPDRPIIKRALGRMWKVTQGVSSIAGLTALSQLPAVLDRLRSLLH